MGSKFWHFLVLVAVVSVCIWASNHIPAYSKLVS